jgi:hypothetical protein
MDKVYAPAESSKRPGNAVREQPRGSAGVDHQTRGAALTSFSTKKSPSASCIEELRAGPTYQPQRRCRRAVDPQARDEPCRNDRSASRPYGTASCRAALRHVLEPLFEREVRRPQLRLSARALAARTRSGASTDCLQRRLRVGRGRRHPGLLRHAYEHERIARAKWQERGRRRHGSSGLVEALPQQQGVMEERVKGWQATGAKALPQGSHHRSAAGQSLPAPVLDHRSDGTRAGSHARVRYADDFRSSNLARPRKRPSKLPWNRLRSKRRTGRGPDRSTRRRHASWTPPSPAASTSSATTFEQG